MKFNDFLAMYDCPGNVVLLEGKRHVREDDRVKLFKLSKLLAENTKHIKFRSGNAAGADNYFSKGFMGKYAEKFEVIIPYKGHRSYDSVGFDVINLEDFHLNNQSGLVIESKINRRNLRIFDAYISGQRNSMAMKAAYLLRDTMKVIGYPPDVKPANIGIFYDDLQNPIQGGTGHTMNICMQNSVPLIDQRTWFTWI